MPTYPHPDNSFRRQTPSIRCRQTDNIKCRTAWDQILGNGGITRTPTCHQCQIRECSSRTIEMKPPLKGNLK